MYSGFFRISIWSSYKTLADSPWTDRLYVGVPDKIKNSDGYEIINSGMSLDKLIDYVSRMNLPFNYDLAVGFMTFVLTFCFTLFNLKDLKLYELK